MNVSFKCPGCAKTMVVDRRFAGASLNCPNCSAPIVIPDKSDAPARPDQADSDAKRARRLDDDFDLADDDLLAANDDASSSFETVGRTQTITTTQTQTQIPTAADTPTAKPLPPFDPKADPDDPILKNIPDFVPNPFGISYPLESAFAEVASDDEDDDPFVNSKMPSLDELIN